MESKITIVRDNNGKVLGTKRQNPPAKPVIKKPLTNTEIVSNNEVKSPVIATPTLAEVKTKMARGENLTNGETQVLFDSIKKTEAEYAARRKQNYRMVAPMKDFIPEKPKFAKPKSFSEPPKTSVTALSEHSSAKTEFPPKPYPTASDRYLQQQEKIRQFENSARPKSTGYRPLDNNPQGGIERAMKKMRQLGETKAELTEKFAKILEFCKKYGKSIKA